MKKRISLLAAGLVAASLVSCQYVPVELQKQLMPLLPTMPTAGGSSVQKLIGVTFEMKSCTLTADRTFICRMTAMSSYRDRVLNLAVYGSKLEIQDDTGTPYRGHVTFGTDPRGNRRTSTLIADTSYDITIMVENVSTRATKVRSVLITKWNSAIAGSGSQYTNITFTRPNMIAESSDSAVATMQPSTAGPSGPTASSTKEKFGISFNLQSCSLGSDRAIVCRMKVESRYQDRVLSLSSYGSKVEVQDDTGTPYPAKVTFGVDPRGARRKNTLIADTSYDITLLIENVSTRATKVRSIQIVGWKANLATGGGGGSISFIYSHPVMVAPEQASPATSSRATAPTTATVPPSTTTNTDTPTSPATSVTSSMEPGPSQNASSLEFNTNRYGGDFHSFEIADSDPRKCEKACNDDGRCKSWSYVKPNIQGPNARCWLKNVVPRATPNNCCISGISR